MRRRAKKHPLVEKVFNIIVRTDPPDFGDLTVKNIAKKLKVSPEHLSRVFKKAIMVPGILFDMIKMKFFLDKESKNFEHIDIPS